MDSFYKLRARAGWGAACVMRPAGALGLLLTMAGVAWGQRPATFAALATYATGANSAPISVVVADATGDGRPDIVVTNHNSYTIGVLAGQPNGTLAPQVTYSTGNGSYPYAAVVGDVNGDGRPDLVIANFSSSIGVMLGQAGGTFGPQASYSMGLNSTPRGVLVADTNSDGRLDVVSANYIGGTAGVLLGQAGGSLGGTQLYSVGPNSGPFSVAMAYVNADGTPDLLTSNHGTSSISVLPGQASGFGAPINYPLAAGSQPATMAVADMNADGVLDIVTANYGNNAAGLLLGLAGGGFDQPTAYPAGPNSHPYGVAVGDVNGDGLPDIVTANYNSNSVGVLLAQAGGGFAQVVLYTLGSGGAPVSVAISDVNGDSRPDIVIANYNGNTLNVLYNTTVLATRPALPSTSVTLAPNPASGSTTLRTTGLPAEVRRVEATLYNSVGQPARRLTAPAAAGTAQATVPTAGLPAGVYLLRLGALDAQGEAVGALPTQRLVVE